MLYISDLDLLVDKIVKLLVEQWKEKKNVLFVHYIEMEYKIPHEIQDIYYSSYIFVSLCEKVLHIQLVYMFDLLTFNR